MLETDIYRQYTYEQLRNMFQFIPCVHDYTDYLICEKGICYSLVRNQLVFPTKGPNTKYVGLTLHKDVIGRGYTAHVHRVLASAFLPNNTGLPFSQCQIDHLDGNKLNNTISNLEIVSPQQNKARAYTSYLRFDNIEVMLVEPTTSDYYIFNSMAKASEFLGVTPGALTMACKKHYSVSEYMLYRGYYVFLKERH